ncbi:GON-4-like protein [Nilaparvata lugens]|uniref:GON-4-like protein n=1 Tax=Nilaparvata lugens TaxID=108931 RepID=UPI00193CAFA1|nr:GON-4-like protein [Nilaparvata lugens]
MMSSNSPIASASELKSKGGPGCAPKVDSSKRRGKAIKNLEQSIKQLERDSKPLRDEKDLTFAQAYLVKASEQLEPHVYTRFVKTLSEFEASRGDSMAELYRNVNDILKNTPDLEQEFLAFLLPEQAMEVGRFIDHLCVVSMRDFFRKLEVCFAKQPHQMRKIYETLSRLSEQTDVTLEQVKTAVVPLLKGNAILIDCFLQLFPSERPPSSICGREESERLVQFENGSDPMMEEVSDLEVMEVPEVDDPYGGRRCPCKCHRDGSALHCTSCGLKFIKGRAFIQRGKALRQAELVVEGVDRNEFLQRIAVKSSICRSPLKVRPKKRPAEGSPSKNYLTGAEDDYGEIMTVTKMARLKQMKTPRSKLSTDSGDKTAEEDDDEEAINMCNSCFKDDEENIDEPLSPSHAFSESDSPKRESDFAGVDAALDDTPQDSGPTNFCHTEIDSKVDVLSDLDVLVKKDDSQLLSNAEANLDAGLSAADARVQAQSESSWTREEDKVILQTFQQDGDSDKIFTKINAVLPLRSLSEIRSRFQVLMQLLNQMAQSDDHPT